MIEYRLNIPIDFSDIREDGLVEIQLTPAGKFFHRELGEVDLSDSLLDSLVATFRKNPNSEVVTDYNHGSSKPKATAEQGKASGWIKKVLKKVTDGITEGVFALWKPTKKAIDFVQEEEYKYFSPTLRWGDVDQDTGTQVPLMIKAAGLTNRPFFDRMKPLDFSSVSDDDPTGITLYSLADDQTFAEKTDGGLKYPISAYAYTPDPESPSTWKLRLWETPEKGITARQVGAAIAALGKGFRGNKVEIPSEDLKKVKSKVLSAWKKANPDKSETDAPRELLADDLEKTKGVKMKDLIKRLLKSETVDFSDVLTEDMTEEEIVEAIENNFSDVLGKKDEAEKELAAAKRKSKSKETELQKLRGDFDDLRKTVVSDKVNVALDKFQRADKFEPKDRDFWKSRLEADFDDTSEYLEKAPVVINTETKGTDEDVRSSDSSGSKIEKDFSDAIDEVRKDENLSYSDAFAIVSRDKPELAEKYRQAQYERIHKADR